MVRNIDYLFGLQLFREKFNQDDVLKTQIGYLLSSGKISNVQETLIEISDQKRIQKLMEQICSNPLDRQGAVILALIFTEEISSHLSNLSTPPYLEQFPIDNSDLDKSDFVIPRLLEPYDERFIIMLLAGFLEVDDNLRKEAHLLSVILEIRGEKIRYLYDLATDGRLADSQYSLAYQLHNLIVCILTDPSPIFPVEQIPTLLQNSDISGVTVGIVDAFKSIQKAHRTLNDTNNVSPKKLPLMSGLDVWRFLVFGTATIVVRMEGGFTQTILINVGSAVDFLYGKSPKPSEQDWIANLLKRQNIRADRIIRIESYNLAFNLSYTRPRKILLDPEKEIGKLLESGFPLSETDELKLTENFNLLHRYKAQPGDRLKDFKEKAEKKFIEYLAQRFKIMFDFANTFIIHLEKTTDFDATATERVKYGRLPIAKSDLWLLPITVALEGKITKLMFHLDNLLEPQSGDIEEIWLQPITGLNDQIIELIYNVFFDKTAGIYFLRSQDEMLRHLSVLTQNDLRMIQDVDFAPYLASMHYENMGLPASSYKGYLGLIKVIEIHSLRHIRWGTSEQYPFYYPGMY